MTKNEDSLQGNSGLTLNQGQLTNWNKEPTAAFTVS